MKPTASLILLVLLSGYAAFAQTFPISWQNSFMTNPAIAPNMVGYWSLVQTNSDLTNSNSWGIADALIITSDESDSFPESYGHLWFRVANSVSQTNVDDGSTIGAIIDLTNSVPQFLL